MLGANAIPALASADFERTAAGLAGAADSARAKAPKARVLLVDYLTVVGESTKYPAAFPIDEAGDHGLSRDR